MKKSIYCIVALLATLMATSCEKNNYVVADYITPSCDFAAVFDAKQIAANAGITVTKGNTLEFPAEFVKGLPAPQAKDIEYVNDALSNSGVDLSSMGIYVPEFADNKQPVYILQLSNTKKFVEGIKARGYTPRLGQLGIKSYAIGDNPEIVIATRGNMALVIYADGDVDNIWRYFYNPDESHLSRQTDDTEIIVGDVALATKLPADVRRFISAIIAGNPDAHDCLLFAKALTTIILENETK